jgi:hypothetical protein
MDEERESRLRGKVLQDAVSAEERVLLADQTPPSASTASEADRRLRLMRRRRRRFDWLWGLIAGVILLALAVWLLRTVVPESFPPAEPGSVELERVAHGAFPLYFAAEDGSGLVEEVRLLPRRGETMADARTLLEALIAGPVADGLSPWPAEATVRDVFVSSAGIAYVNFGGALRWLLPRGDFLEWALVASVTRSLCANFPEIRGVRILIDGQSSGRVARVMPLEWTYRPAMFGG